MIRTSIIVPAISLMFALTSCGDSDENSTQTDEKPDVQNVSNQEVTSRTENTPTLEDIARIVEGPPESQTCIDDPEDELCAILKKVQPD